VPEFTQYPVITQANAGDVLLVTDVTDQTSGPAGTTKQITAGNLLPSDWVTVTSFGADRSGGSDSTNDIRNAISAARASGLGVSFPAGTYKISGSLLPGGGSPGAITLAGDGWDSQIFLAAGSNAYIFDTGLSGSPQYTPGLVVKDLYLNCNGANQSSAGGGIYARGCVWSVFDHLWIETPWDHGIRFYQDGTGNAGHHDTVLDCLFRDGKNSGGAGLAMRVEQADECRFIGCTFQDCGNTSAAYNGQVYDTAAGLSSYLGCAFVGGASGAPFLKSDSSPGRLVFSGCQFDGSNGADSVLVQGSGHVFAGNQFLNVGHGLSSGQAAAIHLNGASGAIIEGNVFAASTVYATAILEDSGANGNLIGLNSFTGTWLSSAPVVTAGAATAVLSGASVYLPPVQSATAVATGTGGTIATAGLNISRVSPAAAVTGVILAAGTRVGARITVVNESAFTIQFAAAATSHVADGTASSLPALASRDFTWDSATSLWYRSG